jgi:hypothetical protein
MPDTMVTFRSCLSISAISERCCLFFMWWSTSALRLPFLFQRIDAL